MSDHARNSVPDQIRRLSDELARDPSSLAFIALGDALRHARHLELALKIAQRGVERHAESAAAHDLIGRVSLDRDDLLRALEAWTTAERLSPGHPGARRGMGYVLFRLGRLDEAAACLAEAARTGDADAAAALARVRALLGVSAHANADVPMIELEESEADHALGPPPANPLDRERARRLFAEALGDGNHTALLLDANGLVVAGAYVTEDGTDVGSEIGGELRGVRDEAERMSRYLELGSWKSVVFETDVATVAMAPMGEEDLLLVASDQSTPLGLVRRVTERCADRARRWLAEVA
ncbi:MAG: tetratricopeptide repeat protein [Gemmatimonadaceae bacterium]